MTLAATSQTRVSVGIGQIGASDDPAVILVAYGLGSCIGVSVWHPQSRWGALLHVLLPDSNGAPFRPDEPARYADHAIEELLRRFDQRGDPRQLVVKLAGGAMVLGRDHSTKFKIGERNAEAMYRQLERFGLRLAAADVGGTAGRTLELHVASGKSFVRTATSPAREF